ncbi:dTDP-4-amino-4,6-dideoxygalactose transaminase [Microvirga lupini]|uniref:dTDP-4-amino-4,6-dideoxygalactose transaminase n=1 Tax=Microvirga lupini TaxID=420324 RepID=A0A7W4VQY1_9HYPH|nr:DegT/DnrJ/EryC1/StrS family aminotransferase [Microvirga lupini]MBB3021699.1 dTDP-4-amino-4,6-dideoxygalactose transaminase [Microvirga lupini]
MEVLATRPVASMPWPTFGALLSYSQRPLPHPFSSPDATLWTSARIALWQAIQSLGLKPGDRVALPAFCCGSELEPFLVAGLELSFFSCADDLAPDPTSFREAISGASAAMVTHYFGFPVDLEPALEMTRREGIPLIEDCAHALYTTRGGEQVGLAGDAAIYSFWKTVALPDGGALHLRKGGVKGTPKPPPPELVKKATRHLLSRTLRSHPSSILRGTEGLRQQLRRGRNSTQPHEKGGDEWHLIRFPNELIGAGMSSRSLRIFRATDHVQVRKRRRHNYQRLQEAMAGTPGIVPLVPQLPDGACPLYFPVVVEEAASLRRALATESVGVKHIWPYFHAAVPWSKFPREYHWKDKALGFPVHQSLGEDDIERLLKVVGRWSGR